jgi:TRAP-type uncharacterized transport system substrate-binding protein
MKSSQETKARRLKRWLAPIVGVAALALALFFYFYSPGEKHFRLTMTAGSALDTRHKLATMLGQEMAAHGLTLELQETAGSEEALDRVNKRSLDLALIQGGLKVEGRTNVRQVATLHVEPVHLLVKKELLDMVSEHLDALKSRTVNLGPRGSGTHAISTAILAFAGLQEDGPNRIGYLPNTRSRSQLVAPQVDRGALPDAVFLVSSMPSETARYLVHEHDYRLVPLPFGEAFSLDALAEGGNTRIEKGCIASTTIPAFAYSVEPPVPPTATPTFGTRLLLVAHKDVDRQAIRRLVEGTFTTEFAKVMRPPLDPKLLDLPPEYPWHDGTRLYLERNTPIVSGVLVDAAQKGFAIFAAAASGLFVLWQWYKKRSELHRDEGLKEYLAQVVSIEQETLRAEGSAPADPAALQVLLQKLCQLKTEALERFAASELTGEELLHGFLLHANDVRDRLARLIESAPEQPIEPLPTPAPVTEPAS